MYKVIKEFTDLQDGCYEYHEGDEYPRSGAAVSPSRIDQLLGDKNRQGVPLIKKAGKALKPDPIEAEIPTMPMPEPMPEPEPFMNKPEPVMDMRKSRKSRRAKEN